MPVICCDYVRFAVFAGITMNVYDFDGTIYKGDSTLDFYWYALRKKTGILCFLPKQLIGFVLYALKKIDKTEFKSYFFSFLSIINSEAMVDAFWDERQNRIFFWYHQQKKPDDVVISASPEFLLQPICHRLGISCLIASKVDSKTGAFLGKNCYGEEKVRRFHEECGKVSVEGFYSDSVSDSPMAKLAKHAYYIKNGNVTNWPKEKSRQESVWSDNNEQ